MLSGAELLVECMIKHEVEYIFYVPGAAINPILEQLNDKGPELIVCHHEASAGHMAQAYGKITGKPGFVLVTAGPGATNLVTAMATSYTERSPVIAITGQIGRTIRYKRSHQSIDSVRMFAPITKWSINIDDSSIIPDIFTEAYRLALEPIRGPVHISIPIDTLLQETSKQPLGLSEHNPEVLASDHVINLASEKIRTAKHPLLFFGCSASKERVAASIQNLVGKTKMAAVSTFEGAGILSRDINQHFMGKLGLFSNRPGNDILDISDLVVTIGYNTAEIDPTIWNSKADKECIHIDSAPPMIENSYHPTVQIIGDIDKNIDKLTDALKGYSVGDLAYQKEIRQNLKDFLSTQGKHDRFPIHPLTIIQALREVVTDDNTLISDVGSHQYWISERFYCHRPRYFLTSMGFQTMGVSIPYAIATSLARPGHKVYSCSGECSFLMCSMELATAARLKAPIIHLVWRDDTFNLVSLQQIKIYQHKAGVDIGSDINPAKLAESLGATGFNITAADQLMPTLQKSLEIEGPVVIDIPVDYSDNMQIIN